MSALDERYRSASYYCNARDRATGADLIRGRQHDYARLRLPQERFAQSTGPRFIRCCNLEPVDPSRRGCSWHGVGNETRQLRAKPRLQLLPFTARRSLTSERAELNAEAGRGRRARSIGARGRCRWRRSPRRGRARGRPRCGRATPDGGRRDRVLWDLRCRWRWKGRSRVRRARGTGGWVGPGPARRRGAGRRGRRFEREILDSNVRFLGEFSACMLREELPVRSGRIDTRGALPIMVLRELRQASSRLRRQRAVGMACDEVVVRLGSIRRLGGAPVLPFAAAARHQEYRHQAHGHCCRRGTDRHHDWTLRTFRAEVRCASRASERRCGTF